MSPKPSYLICLILLFSCVTKAQTSFSFFADSLQKSQIEAANVVVHTKEFIYVGGVGLSFPNADNSPVISKLDTSGKTLWTYSTNKEFDAADPAYGAMVLGRAFIIQLVYDTNYLYAVCYVPNLPQHQLWKIKESNGDLVWKKPIPSCIQLLVADKDNIAYIHNDNPYRTVYELVNKRTGNTVVSKDITAYNSQTINDCNFSIDKDGSVYVAKMDSIVKYTSVDLSTVAWRKKVIAPGPGYTTGYVSTLQPNEDGYLYYGGYRASIVCGKMDKGTGNMIWNNQSNLWTNYLTDDVACMKTEGNYVYVSGAYKGFGPAWSAYRVWKLDRSTGVTSFDIAYNPLWGCCPVMGTGNVATTTLEVDTRGNSYISGFEAGNDDRAGVWGISKFDSNGNLIYHNTVFDGPAYASYDNKGICSFIYNNRVFHVGHIQAAPGTVQPLSIYVFSTDTSSKFNPTALKKTSSYFQDFSDVKAIENFSASKYVVYKQVGGTAVLEMHNSIDNDTIWTRRISGGVHYLADKMAIGVDKKISIDILCADQGGYYPLHCDYKSDPDSIYFLTFDSLGTVLKQKRVFAGAIGQRNFKSLQLYADTSTALVYTDGAAFYFYNAYASTQNIGGGYDVTNGYYFPSEVNRKYVYPFAPDSGGYAWNNKNLPPTIPAFYRAAKFNIVSQAGWTETNAQRINENIVISNSVASDSLSILVVGKTYTGQPDIVRYNRRNYTVMWAKPENSNYVIDVAGASPTAVYWAGRKNRDLMIRQLDKASGNTKWEKIIVAPDTGTYYFPVTAKYNEIRKQFVIAGFTRDSSIVLLPSQNPFYIVVDSLGNVVSHWIGSSDLNLNNSLKSLEITQFGQTLIGGSYYKDPYGRSGVLLTLDKPVIADLVATGMSLQNASTQAGQNVTVNFFIKNIGPAKSGSNKVYFFLSKDRVLTPNTNGDTYLGSYNMQQQLDSGQLSSQLSASIQIPSNTASGDYYVFSVANGDNAMPELNYKNNNDSATLKIETVTSVINIDNGQFIKIDPNPAHKTLTVQFKLVREHVLDIELWDLNGQLVKRWSKVNDGANLDVSELPRSVYIAKLYDSKGKVKGSMKIIKQ